MLKRQTPQTQTPQTQTPQTQVPQPRVMSPQPQPQQTYQSSSPDPQQFQQPRSTAGSISSRVNFVYQPRTKEQVRRRANQYGGNIDAAINNDYTLFRIKDGANTLRIIPATWSKAEHYGYDVWIHYSMGPDNQASFLCLTKMLNKPCPICEERFRSDGGDPAYLKDLEPRKRVLVWVISRVEEDEGPLLWSMPWTVDRDLNNVCVDPTTGELLPIDDLDVGYDFSVTKEGSRKNTKYHSIVIARRSSPLSYDLEKAAAWFEFAKSHPVPSCLVWKDYDYIDAVFTGAVARGGSGNNIDDDPVGAPGLEPHPEPGQGSPPSRLAELRDKVKQQ